MKREPLNPLYRKREKGIRSLMIVFMEIQLVMGFPERYGAGETGEFPGTIAGIK
jgi:hypothetical protein